MRRQTCLHRLSTTIHLGLVVATMVFGTLVASEARAQAAADVFDPEMEAMLEGVGPSEADFGDQPIAASTVAPINLQVQWRLWKQSITAGEPGVRELTALRDDATSLGIRNLPAYSTAAYAVASSEADQGTLSSDQAERVFEAARSLAPDLPYPALAYSAHLVSHNPARLPALVGNYVQGIELGWQWPDTRLAWQLKLIIFLLATFFCASVFFVIGQLIRYFGIVAYDGTRLLPRGFSTNQTLVLVMAIVIVPGLLLQSPLLSLLILLLLFGLVQQPNERLVTVIIFASIASLPTLERHLSHLITWPDSPSQRLMHAQYLECLEPCLERLSAQINPSQQTSPIERYTLALAKLRLPGDEHPEQALELLSASDQWPLLLRGPAASLRSAAMIASDDPRRALEGLDPPEASPESLAATHFNRMRAHQLLDAPSAAVASLDAAIKADLSLVRRSIRLDRRDINSALILEPLPPLAFIEHHQQTVSQRVRPLEPVWTALAGPQLPFSSSLLIGLAGMVVILLSIPLVFFEKTSTPCPKCGLARDPSDADKTDHHRYCLPCYRTFVSGIKLAYDARIHNETVLGRRERFQDGLRRALSLVLPGTGHIEAGHALTGFTIACTITFGCLLFWQPMGLLRPSYELFHANWAAQHVVAIVLVASGALATLSAAVRGVTPTDLRRRKQRDRASKS